MLGVRSCDRRVGPEVFAEVKVGQLKSSESILQAVAAYDDRKEAWKDSVEVLSPEAFARFQHDQTERFPPPPPLPIDPELIASAKHLRDFRALTPIRKAEMLYWLQPDDGPFYTKIMTEALLDDHFYVRATMSDILWKLNEDAELANALGYAMRHDLAVAHHVELLDRIPADAKYSLPFLRRCYDTHESRILSACVRAILRTKIDGKAERTLLARLDGNDESAWVVARAFDEVNHPAGLRALLRLARTGADTTVRLAAIEAIGVEPRGKAVQRELVDLGRTAGQETIRLAAIEAIGETTTDPAVLRGLLHHLVMGDTPRVEMEAANTLLNLAPEDHPNRPQVERMLGRITRQWINRQLHEILADQTQAQRLTEKEQLKELEAVLELLD